MNIMPSNSYPKFNHYKSYVVSIDAGGDIDWSTNLPADPCYLLGWEQDGSVTMGVSSEAGSDVDSGSIYNTSNAWESFTPVLCRTLKFHNTGTATNVVRFLIGWN